MTCRPMEFASWASAGTAMIGLVLSIFTYPGSFPIVAAIPPCAFSKLTPEQITAWAASFASAIAVIANVLFALYHRARRELSDTERSRKPKRRQPPHRNPD